MLMRALSVHIAHETAGAARTRHSLRPLTIEGRELIADLGRNAPRDREGVSSVIASEAKQSISPHEERMDCFVAYAPRNDGSGCLKRESEMCGQRTNHLRRPGLEPGPIRRGLNCREER
jgi:hypothetical protein